MRSTVHAEGHLAVNCMSAGVSGQNSGGEIARQRLPASKKHNLAEVLPVT